MALRASKWVNLFETFIKDIRISSKEVVSVDGRGSKLELWDSQKRFMKEVGDGLDDGIHKFNCLKSRQLGITTISIALVDVFWPAMHPGIIGCLVTDDEKKREANRSLIVKYVESFPEGYFGDEFRIVKNNRSMLEFSNGARLDLLVAGTKKKSMGWAEGCGYSFAHLCMAPGTPVIVEHGCIKLIEDVEVGDKVLTHTGASATVIDVLGQPNTKGPMVRLTPVCGRPLTCSEEHKWPTQRGLVRADALNVGDQLVMPVRPITPDVDVIRLSETERIGNAYTDAGWIRVQGAGAGDMLSVDEELGFLVGYYLAEGAVQFSYPRRSTGRIRPAGLKFTRRRNEKSYVDRVAKIILPHGTGLRSVIDREDCLTTSEYFGGVAVAEWVDNNFGHSAGKHIPDYVFSWGEDFCRGLLIGVLCGDGHKADPERMELSTIHSSIAMQVRDIAASLGYGWASCRFKPSGEHSGRNCKEMWRLYWGGDSARLLRRLLNLPEAPETSRKRPPKKYSIENRTVFLPLKKIESGVNVPVMWDISVDHEDHTFRTPYGSTSNTEVSNYGDVEGLKSLEEGFAQQNPHRLFVYESTAKGYNHWHERYAAGSRNTLTERSFFIGWWASASNRVERSDPLFSIYGKLPPVQEEKELIAEVARLYGHKITAEQLAWFRFKEQDAGAERDLLDQNQPWTEQQSFVQTGYSFFATRQINKDIQKIKEAGVVYKAYEYDVGTDFYHFSMRELKPDVDSPDQIELKVWGEPKADGKYVIGYDGAYGRNDHKDATVIEVYRCFADKIVQVAEYAANHHDPRHTAWILFHLCAAYRDCMVNVEVGGPSKLVMQEFDHLRQLLGSEMMAGPTKEKGWEDAAANARWYLYHRPDSTGAGYMYNFETNYRTKGPLMHGMRSAYLCDEIEVKSIKLLNEMSIVIYNDGEIAAPESRDPDKKDDRVFATAFACLAWVDWTRKSMIAEGLTYARVMELESGEKSPIGRRMENIVYGFLKKKQDEADEAEDRPHQSWLSDQGLE